jgi:hypothetical protein
MPWILDLPASAGFLLGLLFHLEDGNNMFLQTVELTPKYSALQLTKLLAS